MPFLPGLAVVFAGIAGNQDHRVEQQVRALVEQVHVRSAKVSAGELQVLGHHAEGAKAVVQKLHVDGLIAGEYVVANGHATVRVVIYSGTGGMRSLSEIPLTGRVLAADDLESLRANLEDEVTSMTKDRDAARAEAERAEEKELATPFVPKAAPKAIATKPAAPEIEIDETPPAHADVSADAEPAPAAADSVSVAELEAMTGGAADAPAVESATVASGSELHLRVAAGLGLAARSFSPGPTTVAGYDSAAVGVVTFAASVQPTQRVTLSGAAERTLEMATPLDSGMAPTSFSRWELAGDYLVHHGAIDVMSQVGLGHRAFTIDSVDPSRSPSCDYSYAVLGARAVTKLGSHVAIHGHVAFEPVLSGSEPTAMAFGSASRWAMDMGAAVEVRAWDHVFARVAADYQRFAWSWDQVGARGAGGAVDGYPSGTLSLGADY